MDLYRNHLSNLKWIFNTTKALQPHFLAVETGDSPSIKIYMTF